MSSLERFATGWGNVLDKESKTMRRRTCGLLLAALLLTPAASFADEGM